MYYNTVKQTLGIKELTVEKGALKRLEEDKSEYWTDLWRRKDFLSIKAIEEIAKEQIDRFRCLTIQSFFYIKKPWTIWLINPTEMFVPFKICTCIKSQSQLDKIELEGHQRSHNLSPNKLFRSSQNCLQTSSVLLQTITYIAKEEAFVSLSFLKIALTYLESLIIFIVQITFYLLEEFKLIHV